MGDTIAQCAWSLIRRRLLLHFGLVMEPLAKFFG
jgi:hypothetical protein